MFDRTPAAFRVLRETLGISRTDLAEILGVSARSVKAWDTHNDAPDEAWEILERQFEWLIETLDVSTEFLDEGVPHDGTPIEVRLSTYRSDEQSIPAVGMRASWHRAAIGLIGAIVAADGYRVIIDEYPRR